MSVVLRWRSRALAALVALLVCVLLAWAFVPKPALYGDIPFSTLVTDREGRPLKLVPADDGRYRLFAELDDIAPVAPRGDAALRGPRLLPARRRRSACPRARCVDDLRATHPGGGRFDDHHAACPAAVRPGHTQRVRQARAVRPRAAARASLRQGGDPRGLPEPRALRRQHRGHRHCQPDLLRQARERAQPGRSAGAGRHSAEPDGPVSGTGGGSARVAGGPRTAPRGVGVRDERRRFWDDRPGTARARVPVASAFAVARAAFRARPRSLRPTFPCPHDAGSRSTGLGRGAHRRARGAAPPGRHRERGRHAGRCATDGGAGARRVRGVLRRGHRGPGERCAGAPFAGIDAQAAALRAGVGRGADPPNDPARGRAAPLRRVHAGELRPRVPGTGVCSGCPRLQPQRAGRGTARGLRRGPVPGLAAGRRRDGPAARRGLWPGAGPRRKRDHHGGVDAALCGPGGRGHLARLRGRARLCARPVSTAAERGSQLPGAGHAS